MRDALLRDLAAVNDVEITTTYDARLETPMLVHQAIPLTVENDNWRIWGQCIEAADAVWLIAPETGGVLSQLTLVAESRHKILLGSSATAIDIASSKYATYKALLADGINIVPTYRPDAWEPTFHGQWVAKLDDGVGCEDSGYFETSEALMSWINQGRQTSHIIQPLMPGIPASISMLCKKGQAWLLSCNRQKIRRESGKFIYNGSVLNGMAQHWPAFEMLAQRVASAIPDLAGYVGVDVLVDGNEVAVLEVNPRLTTSYTGLNEALDYNPAKLVLDLLYNDGFQSADFNMPKAISRNVVEVTL